MRSAAGLLFLGFSPLAAWASISPQVALPSVLHWAEDHNPQHAKSLLETSQSPDLTQHHGMANSFVQRGGGSGNIFNLNIEDVDDAQFWKICVGMLIFTIGVDRAQAFLDYKVRDSEAGQMLLKRVYGEFVMFGVVAITIFITRNLTTVETMTFLQVEFIDIMCSCACCSLIAVIALIFVVFQGVHARFLDFEAESEERENKGEEVPTAEAISRGVRGDISGMAAWQYRVMVKRFKEGRRLPAKIVYSVYLKECFVRDCCRVMNVEWNTWAVVLGGATAVWALKSVYFTGVMPATTYLGLFLTCGIVLFVLNMLLANQIRVAFQKFVTSIPDMAEQSKEPLDHPEGLDWARSLEWAMQFLTLLNMFLLSAFFMHGIHTINVNPVSSAWYFILVTPPLVNTFLLLPLGVYMLSFIEAFYGDNPEALDAVLTHACRLDEDMQYVHMLWQSAGEPTPDPDKSYDLDEFLQALKDDFQLHVSGVRGRRLFASFDDNGDGTVSAEEFLAALKGGSIGSMSLKKLAKLEEET